MKSRSPMVSTLVSFILALSLALLSLNALSAENPVVIIKDFKFQPQEIAIKRGQSVRWENHEKRQYHSVWFKALDEEEPEDYLFPEDSYEREFKQAGTFPYRCGPHPEMTGTVQVAD